jgi:hypothetical protein
MPSRGASKQGMSKHTVPNLTTFYIGNDMNEYKKSMAAKAFIALGFGYNESYRKVGIVLDGMCDISTMPVYWRPWY